jgi:imidazolonepropionase
MWDRLLTGCNIATMDPAVPGPFGAIEDGAIAIQDGRIVRIGRRVEMAGMRAEQRESLGGAWVTPGLVDCHTHLVFGGTRAAEFEQRLHGADYEEIARAGGGIMSTVRATRGSSAGELIASARERLRALMRSGVTTVEIKTGYGLDTATELRLLNAIKALDGSEPGADRTTLLALHALPPEFADRRADYIQMVVDEMLPAAAGSVSAVDASWSGSPLHAAKWKRCSRRPPCTACA